MVFNYRVEFFDCDADVEISCVGYCFGESYEEASKQVIKYFGEKNIISFSLKWITDENLVCADLVSPEDHLLMDKVLNKFQLETL